MTLLSRVQRLADPRSLENAVTSSALIGALTLLDPNRLTPTGRAAYRGATAVLAGTTVAIELSDDTDVYVDPISRLAFSVGAAGVMLALAEVTEHWDRRLYQRLEAYGLPRPRVAMAAGSAALSLVSLALGRGVQRRRSAEHDNALERRPVPEAVRALVLGLLDATEGYGAGELRAQLATAQVETTPGSGDFSSVVAFVVADDVDLAVPHTFTFPVQARFRTDAGEDVRAVLSVVDGLLNALILDSVPGSEVDDEAAVDFDDAQRWPALSEVTFVLDSRHR